MKKRKFLSLLLVTISCAWLVGCNNPEEVGASSSSTNNSSANTSNLSSTSSTDNLSSASTVKKYVVNYHNCNYNPTEYNQGDILTKPEDPISNKEEIFAGWYLDENFNTEASFPITIDSNIDLYARFLSYKDYFLEAREKTLSTDYKYSDSLNVTTLIASVNGPTAKRTGVVLNKKDKAINSYYLANYTSSGALLFDGQEYVIKRDNKIENIRFNEDNELTKYEVNQDDNQLDSSSFAKAIFEYSPDQIKSVEKLSGSGSDGKYEINTNLNATSVITSALNALGSPLIQNIITQLPSIDASYLMSVNYENGRIKTYEYSFTVEVSVATINFNYTLTFDSATNVDIVLPNFDNLFLESSKINEYLLDFKKDYSTYKNQNLSKYKYDVFTLIETDDEKYEVNQKGEASRKIVDDEIYFNNYIDLSTNLDSIYDELENYKVTRANLENGDVYSCVNNLIFADEYTESTSREDNDNYLMMFDDILFTSSNFSAIQNQEANNKVIFVLNSFGVKEVLNELNTKIYLEEESNSIKSLGEINLNSISFEEANIEVIYSDDKIDQINLNIVGELSTKYVNEISNASFSIEYELINQEINEYEIPQTSDDIQLN